MSPTTITASDAHYADVRDSYTAAGSPAAVVVAADVSEVGEAVRSAQAADLPLAVRSGGHGPSTNNGGIVIDLSALRSVTVVDEGRRLVRVEAGARWGEVATRLASAGLAITSGDVGDVGVGGLAVIGGVGLLARYQGLTIDRIRAVEVVLADGRLVRADRTHDADLFWAIRGAGGSFGAVTAFEFEAEPIASVVSGNYAYDTTDVAHLIECWASAVRSAPREITSFLYIEALDPGQPPSARATVVYAGDDQRAARRALAPFALLAPTASRWESRAPYARLMTFSRRPHRAQAADFAATNGLVEEITGENAAAIAGLLDSASAQIVQLRSVGGAVNDVAAGATAYAHRSQNFSVLAAAVQDRAELMEAWESRVDPHASGAYLKLETPRDEAAVRRAYPPSTLARLQDVKRIYDPDDVFGANAPLPREARDATMAR